MAHHPELHISAQTARRFLLGKQGLWPGRRWRGQDGVREAMHALGDLQLDPLNITARSQDLLLHARVADYEPEQWEHHTYEEREFFDWGGWLAVRPMTQLPHYRALMQHEAETTENRSWARQHAALLREMRIALKEAGPLSNRDFATAERRRVTHYRGRKDSAVALYHLWRTGEVMIHHRERFERFYDLTERVAPTHLLEPTPRAAAHRFLLQKQIAFYGLYTPKSSQPLPGPRTQQQAAPFLSELHEDGIITVVNVEGWRQPQWVLTANLPILTQLEANEIPKAWQPIATTTEDEVTFLAPLDPVSARGRARTVFDFDYVWEVYKPAHKRQWGYYVLPILWGDTLVARTDVKLNRVTNELEVLSLALEQPELASNTTFHNALRQGFRAFQQFLQAERTVISGQTPIEIACAVQSS